MHSPQRSMLAAAAMLACLCASHPAAAKQAPTRHVIEAKPTPEVVVGRPLRALADCTPGANLPPRWSLDPYIQPGNDQYYTLIDPGDCATCSDTLLITSVHIALSFRSVCTQPVNISIVGVSPDNPTCATPDPANVIVPVATYTLDPGAIGDFDFEIPLTESVCITDSVFLCFTFEDFGVDCNDALSSPLLIAADQGCQTCRFWNFYGQFKDDLCVVLPLFGVHGPPVHYADADCASCESTPVLPGSWGSLKIRYANP